MLFGCGDAVHDFYHVEPQHTCLLDDEGRLAVDWLVRCACVPNTVAVRWLYEVVLVKASQSSLVCFAMGHSNCEGLAWFEGRRVVRVQ